jgi:hypothetical protein
MEDAVMVVAVGLVVPGDCGAGEEDNRRDENDASDDHDPRRGLVEPGTLYHVRRRSRVGGRRLDRGFWWFSHLLIMPRHGTPIKRCTHSHCELPAEQDGAARRRQHRSGREPTVLAPERTDQPQDGQDDEDEPRDDRHPCRSLVEPVRRWRRRRRDGRRRGGRRLNRRFGCLAHGSHNASGQEQPRPGCSHETTVSYASTEPPARPAGVWKSPRNTREPGAPQAWGRQARGNGEFPRLRCLEAALGCLGRLYSQRITAIAARCAGCSCLLRVRRR